VARDFCETSAFPVPLEAVPQHVLAGPLVISASFDTSVTNRPGYQLVIQQAINDWQALLQDHGTTTNPYPISFRVVDLPGALLGNTSAGYNAANGDLILGSMAIDSQTAFFVDPTPWEDSEFAPGAPPITKPDLLTVVRHELGHALGMLYGLPHLDNNRDGDTFSAPLLNVPMVSLGGGHVDPAWMPTDLMIPSYPGGVRWSIALYPEVSILARAYGYLVPMRYVDPSSGSPVGSAVAPYQTLSQALGDGTALPVLLSNGTHHVPVNYLTPATARTVDSARGGATVIAP